MAVVGYGFANHNGVEIQGSAKRIGFSSVEKFHKSGFYGTFDGQRKTLITNPVGLVEWLGTRF